LSVVALVIVAEQVQQSMECEHAEFRLLAVASRMRLPAGDAARDHDIAQEGIGDRGMGIRDSRRSRTSGGGKTQDVGRVILAPVRPVQGAHTLVADQRHADHTARSSGSDTAKPAGETARRQTASASIGYQHAKAMFTVRHLVHTRGSTGSRTASARLAEADE